MAEGLFSQGDEVRVSSSGQVAKISSIVIMTGDLPSTSKGQAVTVTLDKEVDASRGDILTLSTTPLEMCDQFEVTLVWMVARTTTEMFFEKSQVRRFLGLLA